MSIDMKGAKPLFHRVSYFETDQMGIVHHSNYIRWMEDGRTDYMRQNGVDYAWMETQGVIMPVVSVSCDYKESAFFDEIAEIRTRVAFFNGVRLKFEYEILNEKGHVLVLGKSEHCFLDKELRRPINLYRKLPECCEKTARLIIKEEEQS